MGLCAIARNASSELLDGLNQFGHASSALEAEAHAALLALSLAKKFPHSHLLFESDCQSLINCINNQASSIPWKISPIVKTIRLSSSMWENSSWRWIPRKANEAANLVASLTVRKTCPEVWAFRPPSSLVHVLSRDGLPCLPLADGDSAPSGA